MMQPPNDIDYSIVICTYNPDQRILTRCLRAISQLETTGLRIEIFLVDNNSNIALKDQSYIREFEQKIPLMKILLVEKQGVQYARLAAIEQSNGKYILYIDYDNEPAADYIQQLKKLNDAYPEVAAWGPGEVSVDFIDGIEKSIESYARGSFQERHDNAICFDNQPDWQNCYPFGTGLCTFSVVLKDYLRLANEGRFTLSGRKGNSLSSGEDTQMVLLCIRNGFFAGVSPTLKLKHLIPNARANSSYLNRLGFGTSYCYHTCLLQVFPERESLLQKNLLSPSSFTRKSFQRLLDSRFGKKNPETFQLVHFIGLHAGSYAALQKPIPTFIIWLIKYLKAG